MVVKRGSLVFIEKLTFEDDQVDASMEYEVLLDRRVDKDACTINGGNTAVTLPTGYVVTSNTLLVTDQGVQYKSSTTNSNIFTPKNSGASFVLRDIADFNPESPEAFISSVKISFSYQQISGGTETVSRTFTVCR